MNQMGSGAGAEPRSIRVREIRPASARAGNRRKGAFKRFLCAGLLTIAIPLGAHALRGHVVSTARGTAGFGMPAQVLTAAGAPSPTSTDGGPGED